MGAPRYNNWRVATIAMLALLASPARAEAPRPSSSRGARSSSHQAEKKSAPQPDGRATGESPASAYFATLVWVHGDTLVPIDARGPSQARFDRLVADRINGEVHALDPSLLELLHTVAAAYPRARLELVSGYRSAKFNEMLRKKGHKVANQSQHSEGHAIDFRIYPEGQTEALDPFDVEIWLRGTLHWPGGIGVYPGQTDRFVHADVGKERRWVSR